MKDFKIRIWNGKKKEMIYPSESFLYTTSLCGEVFRGCGTSIKDSENCEIMLFTGFKSPLGQEIYEGDVCLAANGKKYQILFSEGSFRWASYLKNKSAFNSCFLDQEWLSAYQFEPVGHIFEKRKNKKEINNYEK